MQMPVWNDFSSARVRVAGTPAARERAARQSVARIRVIRSWAAHVGTRAVLLMLASSLGAVAVGQETAPGVPDGVETADDIAPERVARLSYTQGGVSMQAVGETVWAAATLNRPLTPGDYLRTEGDGRAEVQTGDATLRMGAGSNFTFLTLDADALRMRLTAGVLNLRVRELADNEVVEIETPQATASILRPGNYRLEVSPSGLATIVKVSDGMLEARGSADQSFVVRAQQVATLTGTGRLAYSTATLGAPDSFDDWALERDRRDEQVLASEAARQVPSEVVGYEDLDSYGTWDSEPGYGYVWTPTRVVSGWSPYSFGRYTYVSGWGWTWIDDAPWGFAPYHYGSWVTIGSRWCWVPGPRHGRPVGRPIGRPSAEPRHGWHVPPPPRSFTARTIPSGVNGSGMRPSFTQADRDELLNRGRNWRDQREREWRSADQTANNGNRFRTVPDADRYRDGDRYRNVRPGIPRNDVPQAGGSAIPSAPPVVTPTPSEDRRMRIPRGEIPQSTYPRNRESGRDESRAGLGGRMNRQEGGNAGYSPPPRAEQPRREAPREVQRPTPPPQPPPQQSTRQESPRPSVDRGSSSRSVGGRPRTLER